MLVFVFVFDFLCLMLIECSGVARRQTSVGAERVWRRGGDLCAQVLFVSVVFVLFICCFFCVEEIYMPRCFLVSWFLVS